MYLLLDSKETATMFAKATNCAQLMECLAQLEQSVRNVKQQTTKLLMSSISRLEQKEI